MIDRCYNPNCKEYTWYGAKGVYVCDSWHDFNSFLKDVESIDSWDLEAFSEGNLQLDKDIKYANNYIYSVATCKWVTKKENLQNLPSKKRKMLAIDPDGNEYIFYNQTQFAREHNLQQTKISKVLLGERPHHKGWNFRILNDYKLEPREPKKLLVPHYVAYKDGVEVYSHQKRTLVLRYLNLAESDKNLLKLKKLEPIGTYTFKLQKRDKYSTTNSLN